eukprot:CAMPEP_0198225610 /NCGR_PEP_ID=MMETSP1445-20131203/101848_1 /TAXON_ID=36898 /ORGANISM="Pyramimonas sp., Strain CCMP2087" /LENGTH=57 /DNA_ID=CAMNT_0043905191 /DNA_START=93 /DNA_END=263 /DNA_ORIENTATION=+
MQPSNPPGGYPGQGYAPSVPMGFPPPMGAGGVPPPQSRPMMPTQGGAMSAPPFGPPP